MRDWRDGSPRHADLRHHYDDDSRNSLGGHSAIHYTYQRAVEVVEGTNPVILSREHPPMLTLAIPLSIVGLGVFCWILYSLAVYALPFFIGLSVAFYAHVTGAGAAGTIILGLLSAGFVLAIGQTAFATAHSPVLRIVLGLTFTIPASLAGYYASLTLGGLTIPSEGWRHVFALVDAVAIGATAWLRLAAMPAGVEAYRLPVQS